MPDRAYPNEQPVAVKPATAVQKLCVNCEHFAMRFRGDDLKPNEEVLNVLQFRCEQGKFDLKGRPLAHGQFIMYMYMGQRCDKFQVLDFSGPKGRAGLPSGEQFGSGGLLQVDPPPPSEQSQSEVL